MQIGFCCAAAAAAWPSKSATAAAAAGHQDCCKFPPAQIMAPRPFQSTAGAGRGGLAAGCHSRVEALRRAGRAGRARFVVIKLHDALSSAAARGAAESFRSTDGVRRGGQAVPLAVPLPLSLDEGFGFGLRCDAAEAAPRWQVAAGA